MSNRSLRQRMEARLVAEGKLPPRNQPSPGTGKDRLYALGRLKTGEKNVTEQRFEDEVLHPRLMTREILWYRFEGIKLRLADNTFLTVDYAVLPADGALTMIDVKGARQIVQEDARVKMRVGAAQYPFRFQMAFPGKDGWSIEDVG